MIKLMDLLQEEDYKGTHTAPNKTSGAPLHNLTQTYPDDIQTISTHR
jgi:hypothetical protein